MPGTIHVSVLGFKDLPSSSISLKVSMGKRVYQAGDNEDFSFPLTTLRDNMIITLHDTEGREISNTGVQTMSVVQKGFWDEFLPLPGGGHMQLKLKFVLSEEERNRIREMREAAMKKKHGERFSSSLRLLESGAAASVATLSFSDTQEVSERQFLDFLSAASSQDSSRSSTTDPEVANSLAIDAGKLHNPEGVPMSEDDTTNNQKQIIPTDADGRRDISSSASLSKRINKPVNYDKSLGKSDAIFQETSSSMMKTSVPSQEERPNQELLEGLPSNTDADRSQEISSGSSVLKRMDKRINYDRSLVKIDANPDLVGSPQRHTILQLTSSSDCNNDTYRSQEIASAASVLESSREQVNDTNLSKPAEKIGANLPLVDTPKRSKIFQETTSIQQKNEQPNQQEKQWPLRRTPSNVRKMISAFETSLDKDLRRIKPPPMEVQSHSTAEEKTFQENPIPAKLKFGKLNNPFLAEELKRIQTNETRRNGLISLDRGLSKTSPEFAEFKDSISAEPKVAETDSFMKPREDFVKLPEETVPDEPESLHEQSNVDQNTRETTTEEPLERSKGEDSCGDGHSSSLGSSGAWIFADHMRRLCVTTGRKEATDLVEPCGSEETNHKGEKMLCLQEKHGISQSEICTEMESANKTSHEMQKSRSDSSSETGNHAGPIGQVIKVAIMVGFGALVLLTRQRMPR